MRQRKAATPLLPQHRGNFLDQPSRRKRQRQGYRRRRSRVSMAAWTCCAVVIVVLLVIVLLLSLSSSSSLSHPMLHQARNFTKHQVAKIIDKVHHHHDNNNNIRLLPNSQQQQQQPPKQTFPIITCSDGTTHGFLNDNYCDCPFDGIDEPDTSACAMASVGRATFACHDENDNKDVKPTSIFASRVHDGVRDCPNGRDER